MTNTLPRSRGDKYAIAALKNKRASMASEIVQLERQLRHLKESVGHVDYTLKLLDPECDPDTIPNKRPVRHAKLFRQGELGRMILGALRDAERERSTAEIVAAVLAAGGYGEGARRAIRPRVQSNLGYLTRRGMVVKRGSGKATRWQLVNS
jgi:hypothetical protein